MTIDDLINEDDNVTDLRTFNKKRQENVRREKNDKIDVVLTQLERDVYAAIDRIEDITGDREDARWYVTHHLDVM